MKYGCLATIIMKNTTLNEGKNDIHTLTDFL